MPSQLSLKQTHLLDGGGAAGGSHLLDGANGNVLLAGDLLSGFPQLAQSKTLGRQLHHTIVTQLLAIHLTAHENQALHISVQAGARVGHLKQQDLKKERTVVMVSLCTQGPIEPMHLSITHIHGQGHFVLFASQRLGENASVRVRDAVGEARPANDGRQAAHAAVQKALAAVVADEQLIASLLHTVRHGRQTEAPARGKKGKRSKKELRLEKDGGQKSFSKKDAYSSVTGCFLL